MAVGEEATLLPTHASRCPQSGTGHHATSQRARRVAIGSLMLLMSCALVGTLSHVSAGARYYGIQAASKQAAATQQLYEYYEQLLDQTAEHPMEKPAVRAADPLQVTQLEEEDAAAQPTNPKQVAAPKQSEELNSVVDTLDKGFKTQELEENKENEDVDGVSSSENALQAQIKQAEEELASSDEEQQPEQQPEQQMLATVNEQDDDEKQLAVHQQSLKVLQQMLKETKLAEKHTKHRLMVKAIAKEVMSQIQSLQTKGHQQLAPVAKDVNTQQLFESNHAKESELSDEIAQLEKPTTQELYEANHADEQDLAQEISTLSKSEPRGQELLELKPGDDSAVHTQALGMLKELITKAKAEVISEEQSAADQHVLQTADGVQFQTLDEEDEQISEPRVLKTSDGVQFQTLDEDDEEIVQPQNELSKLVQTELATTPAASKAAATPAATEAAATPAATQVAPVAPPAVAKSVVAAPKIRVSTSSSGSQAEDALAKKVAEELQPSIGAKLTAQIMQQVEKSIEANEAKLETEIKAAAVNAAKNAIDTQPASPAHTEVTTTVEKSPSGVTKTTITKHIVHNSPPVEVAAKKAAAAKVTKALESPAVDQEIKALEAIAVKKHEIDSALLAKEKSVVAKAKSLATEKPVEPVAEKPASTTTTTSTTTVHTIH